MKASVLISELTAAVKTAGDLEILVRYPEDGSAWEDFSVVPDPPTPMECDRGEKGTIDINIVGSGNLLPELFYYRTEDHVCELPWDEDEAADARNERERRGMAQYRIIFEVEGQRYYCNVEAMTIWEALGVFFMNHPHITYEMIVDHMEI